MKNFVYKIKNIERHHDVAESFSLVWFGFSFCFALFVLYVLEYAAKQNIVQLQRCKRQNMVLLMPTAWNEKIQVKLKFIPSFIQTHDSLELCPPCLLCSSSSSLSIVIINAMLVDFIFHYFLSLSLSHSHSHTHYLFGYLSVSFLLCVDKMLPPPIWPRIHWTETMFRI